MAEGDLPGDAGETHDTEGKSGLCAAEADFEKIARLMDLHHVPRVEAGGVTKRSTPEARAARGSARARPPPAARGAAPGGAPPAPAGGSARCDYVRRCGVAIGMQS